MLTFFRTVADRSPLPVILYNVPVFTGYDLPVDLVGIEAAEQQKSRGSQGDDLHRSAREEKQHGRERHGQSFDEQFRMRPVQRPSTGRD